jgi:hypothetical protein
MRAAWYEKQGPAREVLKITEMADPTPGPGQVRIRMVASGINPGDIKKRQDAFGYGMPCTRVIPHSGEHRVPMSELFPPDFARRFTDFLDIEEMFKASGFCIESTEDFAKIPDDAWGKFIAERTLFARWHDMQEKAGGEWASKKLGFSE